MARDVLLPQIVAAIQVAVQPVADYGRSRPLLPFYRNPVPEIKRPVPQTAKKPAAGEKPYPRSFVKSNQNGNPVFLLLSRGSSAGRLLHRQLQLPRWLPRTALLGQQGPGPG